MKASKATAQLRGKLAEKLLLAAPGARDHGVLVLQIRGIGEPHPRVLVRANHFIRRHLVYGRRAPAGRVHYLHRCRTRLQHVDGPVQVLQVRVQLTRAYAANAGNLQRSMGNSQLDGRKSHVVVVVDQAGNDHVVGRTYPLRKRMILLQRLEVPNLDDASAFLIYRAIGND